MMAGVASGWIAPRSVAAGFAVGSKQASSTDSSTSDAGRPRDPLNPNRIALLADPHIAADPAATDRSGTINLTDSLRHAVRQILDSRPHPSRVVLNGDASLDVGEREDYTQLLELLRPLREAGMTVHLTLGNHDSRDHWIRAIRPDLAAMGIETMVAEHRIGQSTLILLDSLEVVGATPGSLGEAQLEWLDRTLAAQPRDQRVFIFVHHPPIPLAEQGDNPWALRDADAMLTLLNRHECVQSVFVGHSHRWETQWWSGSKIIYQPSTAYTFDAEQPRGWLMLDLAPTNAVANASGAGHLTLHTLNPNDPRQGDREVAARPVALPRTSFVPTP